MSNYIIRGETPRLFKKEMAMEYGLGEAIVFQQIVFWQDKMNREIFNTYNDWQEQFPWWSVRTIRRIIESLEEKQLIVTRVDGEDNNKKYYQVNFDHAIFNGQTYGQIDQGSGQNDLTSPGYTQNTHKNTQSVASAPSSPRATKLVVDKSSASWKDYEAWIAWWNKQRGQRRAANDNDFKNFQYWLEKYDLLDMKAAIIFMRYDSYWGSENVAPGVMLRQFLRDKVTACDHFGDFLSIRQPGNPDVEGLRSDYMKLRTWFDNGQPIEQLTDVFMTLKHFGYEELVVELAQKAKEAQHVS